MFQGSLKVRRGLQRSIFLLLHSLWSPSLWMLSMKITDVHILLASPSLLQLSENGSPQREWARSQDWCWIFLASAIYQPRKHNTHDYSIPQNLTDCGKMTSCQIPYPLKFSKFLILLNRLYNWKHTSMRSNRE